MAFLPLCTSLDWWGGDYLMLMFGRIGRWALLATSAATAGCGSTSHPDAGTRAPISGPGYFVSAAVPAASPRRSASRAPQPLADAIARLHREFGGKTGIAIRAVDAGWTVEAGGRQRLPQQSVSKLWVAITVLDQRDQGRLRLDDPIVVRPEDLTLFHQPVAILVKGDGYHTTIDDLFRRALTHSDNTANDRLLARVGGPAAVRATIARKQLGDIRFGPGERLLQSQTAGLTWQPKYSKGGEFEAARSKLPMATRVAALDAYTADPIDGAAPLAIADALARLARGELLSETSTRILLDTMGESVTGRARLRAALPAGWQIAHKTGTGQDLGARNAGFNDVGLLTSPANNRYTIAVMIGDSTRSMRERQELIQHVAAAVADYDAGHGGARTASR